MQSFDFISTELTKFIILFPNTRVRYENNTETNTHFIEVVPNQVYHLDEHYINWENTFFEKFIALFPEQNICFISDDATVGLDRVDFELYGSIFNSLFTINSNNYIIPKIDNNSFIQLENKTPLFVNILVNKGVSNYQQSFNSSINTNFDAFEIVDLKSLFTIEDDISIGENKYAFAA